MANINQSMQEIIAEMKAKAIYDQRGDLANVIGSPAVGTDSVPVLLNKLQTNKNNLASNLGSKGVTASGTESIESLVGKVGILSNIKKIQKGSFSKLANEKTKSIPIESIDVSKSIILYNVESTGGSSAVNCNADVYLDESNPSVIKSSFMDMYGYGDDKTYNIEWQIIEFDGVKVQRGVFRMPSYSGTTTINAIDTTKSVLFADNILDKGSSRASQPKLPKAKISDSTTLSFYTDVSETSIRWQVLEIL